MALATRRSYAGAAPACTLSSDIAAGATSFSITGTTTNWPTTATGPFYMVIDPGLSTEEKVLVGARTSGSLSSVTRGVDGTTAASHVTGATCYPVFTAVDANDANLLASRLSAKGDLISSDGSDPTKVAVGANNTRLVADSAQTSGIKWVADTQNTVADAKGDLLVGTAADTIARLAVGSNDQFLLAASGETTGLKWGYPAGTVLQVVSTTLTTIFSASVASAGTADVTGLSASITPKSSSSKVLVIVNMNGMTDVSGSYRPYIQARLKRGATVIGGGTTAGNRTSISAGGGYTPLPDLNTNISFSFLDSPATTSSTTYQVSVFNTFGGTYTLTVNQIAGDTDAAATGRPSSTITLMEVAA